MGLELVCPVSYSYVTTHNAAAAPNLLLQCSSVKDGRLGLISLGALQRHPTPKSLPPQCHTHLYHATRPVPCFIACSIAASSDDTARLDVGWLDRGCRRTWTTHWRSC